MKSTLKRKFALYIRSWLMIVSRKQHSMNEKEKQTISHKNASMHTMLNQQTTTLLKQIHRIGSTLLCVCMFVCKPKRCFYLFLSFFALLEILVHIIPMFTFN